MPVNGPAPAARDAQALWDDGKDPGALRTIGEVGQALAIKQHVLRYWEDQFPMLRPLKRSGGRRYYRPEDIALVRQIDQLVHREGYTLRGARAVLEGLGRPPVGQTVDRPPVQVPAPGSPAAALPADTLDRLRAIRARLAAALSA